MLSIRDPVHGFIRADPLETALIDSRPVQRLRWIRQLGLTFMVFPGAEHSFHSLKPVASDEAIAAKA